MSPPSPRAAFRIAAVGCLLITGYLGLAARDVDKVRDGVELLERGDYAGAAARVDGVRVQPASGEAALVRAYAARGRRDRRAAEQAFADALRSSPNDWAIRRDRALNLLDLGLRRRARREMSQVLKLNPSAPIPPEFHR